MAGEIAGSSKAIHFFDGAWHEGNPRLMSAQTHAAWLGSTVFDGARTFEGVSPDLGLHCQRLVDSARYIGLNPTHQAGEVEEILREGIAKFPSDQALYLRPMMWGEDGFIAPEPESANYCFSIMPSAMPEAKGAAITLSPLRRPTPDQAPTHAKAACHYPHSGRAMREAQGRGFDNAVMLDALGNVAELTSANVWMAKDGAAYTPIANGCFLAGITRARVLDLLNRAGVAARESVLSYQDLLEADELFTTGNYGKVLPITRIDGRDLQPGPIYAKARELYWAWAHGDF